MKFWPQEGKAKSYFIWPSKYKTLSSILKTQDSYFVDGITTYSNTLKSVPVNLVGLGFV